MKKSMLSILGVVGLVGFIDCGELDAMHRLHRNNSLESVYNNTNAVELLPTRNAETRQNDYLHRILYEERSSSLKEKLVNGSKWLGIGCVALAEGIGRFLGVAGSFAVAVTSIAVGFVALLPTCGFSLLGIFAGCYLGSELFNYTIDAYSITKLCMIKWDLKTKMPLNF